MNTLLSLRSVPLPLLQKINSKGEMIVLNYTLSINLFMSLCSALPKLIPINIKKVYFINNYLDDESLQELFGSLENSVGLRTMVVAKNGLGSMTTEKIIRFVRSEGFAKVRKFVIKDPVPSSINKKQIQDVPRALME